MARMNEATNVSRFPAMHSETPEEHQTALAIRCTNALGVTMPNSHNPRGWSFNPATVTLTLIVAFLLMSVSYYQGSKDRETQLLLDKLEKIEKTAQQAKDLSLGGGKDWGHNTNANK